MTILWGSDCCLCIVEVEFIGVNVNFINWIRKCDIHKTFSGQILVDNVVTQCRKYQIVANATRTQKDTN